MAYPPSSVRAAESRPDWIARKMVLLLVPAWSAACRSPNVVMVHRVPRDGPRYGAAVAVNRALRRSHHRISKAAVGSLGCALTRLGQDEREQPRALRAASRAPQRIRTP